MRRLTSLSPAAMISPMTRFERTTRILILVLWGLAFLGFCAWWWLGELERAHPLRSLEPERFRLFCGFFFVTLGGLVAAGMLLVVAFFLGRKALGQAFRELSYPQFAILTMGVAFALAYAHISGVELFYPKLRSSMLQPSALDPAPCFLHELAYISALNMLTVFVPSAVLLIAVGWPWRLVPRAGLLSATCACIAYVLWCYFFAYAVFLSKLPPVDYSVRRYFTENWSFGS